MSMKSRESKLGLAAAAAMVAFTLGASGDEAEASTIQPKSQHEHGHLDPSLFFPAAGILLGIFGVFAVKREERKLDKANEGREEAMQEFIEKHKHGPNINPL